MSDAAMRDAMVRMATDTEFARRVHEEGPAVARESGLTDAELATLQALGQADEADGPTRMGERLSKSGLFGAGAVASLLGAHSLLCDGHALLCDGHSLLCDG